MALRDYGENEKKDINILLLGETGVGKSTFINAFANYLTYDTLDEAKKDIISLIPTSFTVVDNDFIEKVVKTGDNSDENECENTGESATQNCKCFVFPFGDLKIRLIDTPGIGDTRGVDQDRLNFDDILSFIAQYDELHCICILMKPNNSRINVIFEFCIKQLLSHLQKSASENIIFLFTNARSTFYRPGETAPALRKVLKQITESPPYVEIKLNKETVFCLDNEAFRFLVAITDGIEFTEDETENFDRSWKTSVKECQRLMKYILGSDEGKPKLMPHCVKDTISVNEARRLILSLTQPLAEIFQNIEDNFKVSQLHLASIEAESSNIANLKEKLFVPFIDIEITELPGPRTVCASPTCCKIYEVAGLKKYFYDKICHETCFLRKIPRNVIGDIALTRCWAMKKHSILGMVFTRGTICRICECSYEKHLHIYYESKLVEKRKEDDTVKEQITTKDEIILQSKNIIDKVTLRCNKLKSEMDVITKTTAKFAHFLKNNAIAPYNDSFKSYVEHLIENQESLSSKGANNRDIISGLNRMLDNYQQEKDILDNAMANSNCVSSVTEEDVFKAIEELKCLEIYGQTIRDSQFKKKVTQMLEVFGKEREVEYKPKKEKSLTSFVKKLVDAINSYTPNSSSYDPNSHHNYSLEFD